MTTRNKKFPIFENAFPIFKYLQLEPMAETGPQGKDGEDGEDGEQGIKGDTGSQGIQGEDGEQGIKGDTGLQGEDGIGSSGGGIKSFDFNENTKEVILIEKDDTEFKLDLSSLAGESSGGGGTGGSSTERTEVTLVLGSGKLPNSNCIALIDENLVTIHGQFMTPIDEVIVIQDLMLLAEGLPNDIATESATVGDNAGIVFALMELNFLMHPHEDAVGIFGTGSIDMIAIGMPMSVNGDLCDYIFQLQDSWFYSPNAFPQGAIYSFKLKMPRKLFIKLPL